MFAWQSLPEGKSGRWPICRNNHILIYTIILLNYYYKSHIGSQSPLIFNSRSSSLSTNLNKSQSQLCLAPRYVSLLLCLVPPHGMAFLPYYELSLCLGFPLHPVALLKRFFSLRSFHAESAFG